jgi:hypothetical protein
MPKLMHLNIEKLVCIINQSLHGSIGFAGDNANLLFDVTHLVRS